MRLGGAAIPAADFREGRNLSNETDWRMFFLAVAPAHPVLSFHDPSPATNGSHRRRSVGTKNRPTLSHQSSCPNLAAASVVENDFSTNALAAQGRQ
jgi:hypothetical protein